MYTIDTLKLVKNAFLLSLFFITSIPLSAQNDIQPVYEEVQRRAKHFKFAKQQKLFKELEATNFMQSTIKDEVEESQFFNIIENSILERKPEVLKIPLHIEGVGDIQLKLFKKYLFKNGAKVKVASEPDKYQSTNASTVHYWGVVDQFDHHSIATLSFTEYGLIGMISFHGKTWEIGELPNFQNTYILYENSKLKKSFPKICDGAIIDTSGTNNGNSNSTSGLQLPSMDNCVSVHIEIDHDIYLDKGGVSQAQSYMEGVFSQVAILYENDSMDVYISEFYIWDIPSPYTGTSSADYLYGFRDELNIRGFVGDLAHLVNFKNYGGRAYIDELCDNVPYAYSGINSTYNNVPTYSWTVYVFAHEMGHNIGSRHTHDCVWNGNNTPIDCCGQQAGYTGTQCSQNFNCNIPLPSGGTIMSYCHHISGVGIDFNEGFHDQVQTLMQDRILNSSCLVPCSDDPLVADFEYDVSDICINEVVNFTDLSTGAIASWLWSFQGGSPSSSNNQNPVITYMSQGTFDVTLEVTDYIGNTSELTIPDAITVNGPVYSTAVNNHESCEGFCDGSASVFGGTNYEWSDGQTTATATGLCPGTYDVTVSDANGCSDVASVTINTGNTVNATAVIDQHETCVGDCDGEATAYGGTNYNWSDGQTTATAIGLCPGTYDVTVSDGIGCSDVASVTINTGNTANATAIVDQHETCTGDCDGEATASGGTNYTWSDGQTTATATGLCPGTYDVTVSDANGCSDVASVTINIGNTVNASAIVDQHEICEGDCDGQATASGGASYSWSTGQNTATATGLCAGSYNVTVTDNHGCTDIASVNINTGTPYTNPTFSFNMTNCESDLPFSLPTTSDNGLTGDWSGPGVSNNMFDPGAVGVGNWDITFTPDPGQCANTATVTITIQDCSCQNPASVDAGADQSVCATNTVTVQLNGFINNANTATWTTSGSGWFDDPLALNAVYTPSTADKTTGSVTLTLTTEDPDGSGPCTPALDQMMLSLKFQPKIGEYKDTSDCFEYELPPFRGSASGNIGYFDGPAGTGNLYQPGDIITQTKTIYIYDKTSAGCIDETSFDVDINEVGVTASINQNESCFEECDGQAVATGFSGVMPYSYEWSNNQIGQTAIDLCEDTYTVTVTDAIGCQASSNIMIQAGSAKTLPAFNLDTIMCLNDEPFYLPVNSENNVTGSWSGDGVSSNIFNPGDAGVGSHEINFSPDSGQCATTSSSIINVNDLTVDAGEDTTVQNGTAALLQCNAVAGSGDYIYEWSPDSLLIKTQGASTQTIPMKATHTFSVEVTDIQSGCVKTNDVIVHVSGGPLTISTMADPEQICHGDSSKLSVIGSGGSGQYSYTWYDPNGTMITGNDILVSPDSTTSYRVLIDDGFTEIEAIVTVIVNPLPIANAGDDEFLCFDEPVSELCALENPEAIYLWKQSEGEMRQGRCVSLTAGMWILEVTSNTGCTANDTIVLEELDELILEIYPDTSVDIRGGLPPYSITYSYSGDTMRATVTDANGCRVSEELISTSIDNYNLSNSIRVYPNPAKDILKIQTGEINNYEVILYSQTWQLLRNENNADRLLVHYLPPGIYYLKIRVEKFGKEIVKFFPIVLE